MEMRFDSERNNTRGQDGLSWQVTLQATFGSLSSIMNLFWFSERFFLLKLHNFQGVFTKWGNWTPLRLTLCKTYVYGFDTWNTGYLAGKFHDESDKIST